MESFCLEFYISSVRSLCTQEARFEKYKKPYGQLKDIEKIVKKTKKELEKKVVDNSITQQDLHVFDRLMRNARGVAHYQKKNALKFLLEDLQQYSARELEENMTTKKRKKVTNIFKSLKERIGVDFAHPDFEYVNDLINQIIQSLGNRIEDISAHSSGNSD